IALVGLGTENSGSIVASGTTDSEIVRTAVANGIRQLRARNVSTVSIAPLPHLQATAEGSTLALYKFDTFKSSAGKKDAESQDSTAVTVKLLKNGDSLQPSDAWSTGTVYAEAQNFSRDLTNTPANYMTPTIFSKRVEEELSGLKGVKVNVYDEKWAESQRMGGLLSVSKGSSEPLRFVEIIYRGGQSSDVSLALVGKGVTFDTGGYSLKPGRFMDGMKGDMGGGAAVVAAMRGIAQLQLPVNVVATVPLCENMISGNALKVSDVYTSRAGLTVEVMNTDAEGRLVLADALHYAIETHQPQTIVDVATLTGAMVVALGERYTGVFTSSSSLWKKVAAAGETTDEPVWRMPLHDAWDAMLKSPVADLSNIGNKSEAGACTAAAFLRNFNNDETLPHWAHMDIAGPMEASASSGYHQKGMSGRPTRLLIELARQLS
ncbi:hypothetical protein COEREDRAFT_23103, partial [Coemansia reversa NRRL 1564]